MRKFSDTLSFEIAILPVRKTKEADLMKLFTDHPNSVGETYLEHMSMAFGFGSRMILSGLACLLHGIFPFLFVRTGSAAVGQLHDRMITNRDQRRCADQAVPAE